MNTDVFSTDQYIDEDLIIPRTPSPIFTHKRSRWRRKRMDEDNAERKRLKPSPELSRHATGGNHLHDDVKRSPILSHRHGNNLQDDVKRSPILSHRHGNHRQDDVKRSPKLSHRHGLKASPSSLRRSQRNQGKTSTRLIEESQSITLVDSNRSDATKPYYDTTTGCEELLADWCSKEDINVRDNSGTERINSGSANKDKISSISPSTIVVSACVTKETEALSRKTNNPAFSADEQLWAWPSDLDSDWDCDDILNRAKKSHTAVKSDKTFTDSLTHNPDYPRINPESNQDVTGVRRKTMCKNGVQNSRRTNESLSSQTSTVTDEEKIICDNSKINCSDFTSAVDSIYSNSSMTSSFISHTSVELKSSSSDKYSDVHRNVNHGLNESAGITPTNPVDVDSLDGKPRSHHRLSSSMHHRNDVSPTGCDESLPSASAAFLNTDFMNEAFSFNISSSETKPGDENPKFTGGRTKNKNPSSEFIDVVSIDSDDDFGAISKSSSNSSRHRSKKKYSSHLSDVRADKLSDRSNIPITRVYTSSSTSSCSVKSNINIPSQPRDSENSVRHKCSINLQQPPTKPKNKITKMKNMTRDDSFITINDDVDDHSFPHDLMSRSAHEMTSQQCSSLNKSPNWSLRPDNLFSPSSKSRSPSRSPTANKAGHSSFITPSEVARALEERKIMSIANQLDEDEEIARKMQEELDKEFAIAIQGLDSPSTERFFAEAAGGPHEASSRAKLSHRFPNVRPNTSRHRIPNNGMMYASSEAFNHLADERGNLIQDMDEEEALAYLDANYNDSPQPMTRSTRRTRSNNPLLTSLINDTNPHPAVPHFVSSRTILNHPHRRNIQRNRDDSPDFFPGRGMRRDFVIQSPSAEGQDYESLLALAETIGNVKSKGLSKSTLEQLPLIAFKRDENSDADKNDCLICMNEYSEGNMLRILTCFHRYHSKCIDRWLADNNTCPVCRVEIKFS